MLQFNTTNCEVLGWDSTLLACKYWFEIQHYQLQGVGLRFNTTSREVLDWDSTLLRRGVEIQNDHLWGVGLRFNTCKVWGWDSKWPSVRCWAEIQHYLWGVDSDSMLLDVTHQCADTQRMPGTSPYKAVHIWHPGVTVSSQKVLSKCQEKLL